MILQARVKRKKRNNILDKKSHVLLVDIIYLYSPVLSFQYIIVIPWFVSLYMEIIHELKLVDYFVYKWTNYGITDFIPPAHTLHDIPCLS